MKSKHYNRYFDKNRIFLIFGHGSWFHNRSNEDVLSNCMLYVQVALLLRVFGSNSIKRMRFHKSALFEPMKALAKTLYTNEEARF